MIDWNVATSTGVRWARPGPQVSMAEARKVVAELRGLAATVQEPVREVTGLPGSGDGGKVAVVDRANQAVGALNLSTHATRTTRNEMRDKFLPELRAVAAQIAPFVA